MGVVRAMHLVIKGFPLRNGGAIRETIAAVMLSASGNRGQTKARVWDVPVRVSHWLLVICIAAAWLTRDARLADLHAAAGWCALFLVVFRVVWGFAGTAHARFSDFGYSPIEAIRYVKDSLTGSPAHYTGHNPAGSWSVYLLLAGVALTCVTGIAALAAMFDIGPVPVALAPPLADFLRESHEWLAWALLAVIGVHVAGAIASSVLHRENLVAAMVTGRKRVHEDLAGDAPARRGVAFSIAAGFAGVAFLYLASSGWPSGYAQARLGAHALKPAPTRWTKECGGCHLAYSPALLPSRSWERMLKEQAEHFGEDLSLSPNVARALLDEALADRTSTWAAWKLAHSAPPGESPQRITDLAFWRHAHRGLAERAFKPPVSQGRHDCESCHVDAASGIFQPRMIQKPARESIL
jgi:cytochrome b